MNQMSREERYEYWSLVVEEFENSGETIRSQCRANGIPFAQYYDWRKKIKKQQSELLSPSSFIEVTAAPAPVSRSVVSGITLSVDNSYCIELSSDFNPNTLSSLLKVLRTDALGITRVY